MEEFSVLFFIGLYIVFFAIIDSSASKLTCPFPNLPENGDYSPKLMKFQLGDDITYSCEEAHILVGSDTSRCKSDGKWSHPTPFCDRKVSLINPDITLFNAYHQPSPQVVDSNRSSCFPFNILQNIEYKLEVNLEKQKVVYAVRLYLGKGKTNIAIYLTGRTRCGDYDKYLHTSQWVTIICNTDRLTNTVSVENEKEKGNVSAICEIEVYVKEKDGCKNPPRKEIPNGYLEVSRSKAKLICVDGYKSDFNRLICEENNWINQRLVCEEVLCDPILNLTGATGGDWIFLDPVRKISPGTKRQLKCHEGYRRTGHPDIIECQKSGTWTDTTAECVDASPVSVKTEKYLRHHLFEDYDKLVRPVKVSSHAVPVSIQITPIALRSVDFLTDTLKLDTWLTVEWHDEYLQWDPVEFGGQDSLTLPASEVWKPDIAVYTATPDSSILPHVETNVVVHSNGEVLWVPPFTIENRCPTFNSHEIRQECDISMLSWTYDVTQLDLNIRNTTSMEYFVDDEPRWHLASITALKENKLFSCCKEFYPTIHFKAVLTDKNV